MLVFGQSCGIRAKVVVFGQSGCIWAEMVVFWKSSGIRKKNCMKAKVVVLGQKRLF